MYSARRDTRPFSRFNRSKLVIAGPRRVPDAFCADPVAGQSMPIAGCSGFMLAGIICRQLLRVNLPATVAPAGSARLRCRRIWRCPRTGMRIDATAKLLHPRRRHPVKTGASLGRVFNRFTASGWQRGNERQNTPVCILELVLILQDIEPVCIGDEG